MKAYSYTGRTWLILICWGWLGVVGALPGHGAESFAEQLAQWQSTLAAEPTNAIVLFKLGELCHDEGARNNVKAVLLAEEYLKRLLGLEPTNAWAMALLGSTLTMKARDAFWPKTRLNYVKEGNKTMDAAVALAAENPEVRLVRAVNNFHMPRFLDRETIVRADLVWLWERVQSKPELCREALKQDVALHMGMLLKQQKKQAEASEILKQGLAFNPASTIAQKIREQLK